MVRFALWCLYCMVIQVQNLVQKAGPYDLVKLEPKYLVTLRKYAKKVF